MKSPVEFVVKSGAADKQRGACVITAVFEARKLSPAAVALDRASKGLISSVLRRGDLPGKIGQTLLLHHVRGVAAERVLLVGGGRERDLDEYKFRKINAAAVNTLRQIGAADAINCLPELNVHNRDISWKVRHSVESTLESVYVFDRLKSKKKDSLPRPLHRLILNVANRSDLAAAEQAVQIGMAVANGVRLVKDLGNLPPNICTPTYLADQARELARTHRSLKVSVLKRAQMEKLGMGALLAVARGSHEPPRLIVIEYRGRDDAAAAPVALVGKGVTFDTGGISIKPAAAMDEMKYDMCGAASVLGVLLAVAELQLPLNVVGVMPAVENMPGGNATRPADIVTTLSGQTVEILNTDAEGRLILCDAITYAEREYKPEIMIDIATLTGACVIALGNHASGLFSNDERLAQALLAAGNTACDRAWQMPVWEDYQSQLDSNFADMANVGGREGGAITAACFLARFTRKLHWAHLDIAGTAWRSGKLKGGTGRPVPLLVQYLLDRGSTQKPATMV